jgi:nucleoside-diphosphate-sugar epimerase
MAASKNKILITGAAGFVGYHLAQHLLHETTADLVLVDNLQKGKRDEDFKTLLKNPRATFMKLDLTKPSSFKKLGSGYDHVYHLAAINGTKHFYEIPHEVLRINVLSLIYMLEWFREKNSEGKFCFTSSNEAYAGALSAFGKLPLPTPENVPLVIEDTYNPRWSYGGSKLIGEQFVIDYSRAYKLRALIVRPHNFYGPRAGFDHVIPEFIERVRDGVDPFPIFGADNTRSFCYIEDAVRAMRLLMESKKTDVVPAETVHIGETKEVSIEELARLVFAAHGSTPKKVIIKKAPKGSVLRRSPNVRKLKRLTGWTTRMTLDEGIGRTYEWYAAHPRNTAPGRKRDGTA